MRLSLHLVEMALHPNNRRPWSMGFLLFTATILSIAVNSKAQVQVLWLGVSQNIEDHSISPSFWKTTGTSASSTGAPSASGAQNPFPQPIPVIQAAVQDNDDAENNGNDDGDDDAADANAGDQLTPMQQVLQNMSNMMQINARIQATQAGSQVPPSQCVGERCC